MRRVALKEVVDLNPKIPKEIKEVGSAEVAFLPMQAVGEDGSIQPVLRPAEEVRRGYTYFGRGDIIVAKISPCLENGKAADLSDLPTEHGFGSTEFHVLRRSYQIDQRYLFHMIWSTQFREYASASFKGAVGQQRASDSVVGDFGIPLPPLAEQRRIADLLDQADALRRKRRAALGLLDELLRSTFLEMFGDPVTNPKGWPAKSLAEVALITTGNTPPRDESSYYGSQMAWLKSDNLGHLHSWPTPAEERLSIEGVVRGRTATAGSILVTCIAGSPDSIGKASLLAEEAAFNQQINALTPGNDLLSEYLYALIRCGKRLVQQQSTDGMKGLVSKGRLGEVKVPVPPLLNQRRFRAFFNTWDESCRHALSHAEATEFLFQSLLHQAFQGQL